MRELFPLGPRAHIYKSRSINNRDMSAKTRTNAFPVYGALHSLHGQRDRK